MAKIGVPERNLLEKGVPVELLNQDAKKEKLGKPPISEMHYYHTRKPLIISRLAVAGTLLGEGDLSAPAGARVSEAAAAFEEVFVKFFGLDPSLKERGFRRTPRDLIKTIHNRYPEGVTVLDPFAGSGMIPFEALRLGCSVVAVDYNPVACLIERATLEYPLKYNRKDQDGEFRLFKDVKKHAEEILAKLKTDLSRFYPPLDGKEVKAYILAWAVKCPYCEKETPLIQNWWLDSKAKIYLDYKVETDVIRYSVKLGEAPQGNTAGGKATCLFCTQQIENEHIVEDISKNEREHLLAVYLGKGEFRPADKTQKEALEEAKQFLRTRAKELARFIPTEAMAKDNRSLWAHRYLHNWHRLYNPRQLLLLASLAKEIRARVEKIKEEKGKEYAAAVGTYLSLVLAKHADYNSRGCGWHSSRLTIAHTLTMRGVGMMWNHAETNPFAKFSGSLSGGIHDVMDGLRFALNELNGPKQQLSLETLSRTTDNPNTFPHKPTAEVVNASVLSWNPGRKFKFIVTDPPYYDDVQYPEIMQMFQVWHARTVGDLLGISTLPSTAEELSVGRYRTKEDFERRMLIAIKRLYDLLEDDGVAAIFYAHKSIEGWKYLLDALRNSGFKVTSTISLRTESSENVVARGKSSVYHSLLITARKRKEIKSGDISDVDSEIRRKIEERYDDLVRAYGKDPTNLMVAASGIVIETMTSYSEVKSFTRNLPEFALEAGQRYLIEAFAKRALGLNTVDAPTMVYVWIRSTAGGEYVDYTDFNHTLKAVGVGEEALSGLVEKTGGKIRLLEFDERASLEVDGTEPLVAASLIDALHLTLRAYARSGITSANEYATNSPYGKSQILHVAKALADASTTHTGYREGNICKEMLKGWESVTGELLSRYLS